MLSLDFVENMIIANIDTARTSDAINPNSGTTTPSLISTLIDSFCSDMGADFRRSHKPLHI